MSDSKIVVPPLTVREAAAQLGVSEDIARDLLRKKKLNGFKPGGHWRVPPDAITEFIIVQLSKCGSRGKTSASR